MTSTANRLHVPAGDLQVAKTGQLYSLALGSCVALVLYDPRRNVAGLAHIVLPVAGEPDAASVGRFAPTAVAALVDRMVAAGARPRGMFARIAGGAAMFPDLVPADGAALGERNVAAVKAALAKAAIPLKGEDVGGGFGRSVFLQVDDGKLLVKAVGRGDLVL